MKKKRSNLSRLRIQADKLLHELLSKIQTNCITCGALDKLQDSHYFGKAAFPGLRYTIGNVNRQCRRCHMIFHNRETETYRRAIEAKYGKEFIDSLYHDSQRLIGEKFGVEWVRGVIILAEIAKEGGDVV